MSANRSGWFKAAISSIPISFENWDHYAFTLNGSKGKIYINGVLVANSVVSLPKCLKRTSNFLGRSNFGNDGNPNANAIFDDIRIYNRELSSSEINFMINI